MPVARRTCKKHQINKLFPGFWLRVHGDVRSTDLESRAIVPFDLQQRSQSKGTKNEGLSIIPKDVGAKPKCWAINIDAEGSLEAFG